MTTRRAVRKTPPAPLATEDKLVQRAKKLPLPGPGITVTVALPLEPTYLEIYRLEPMSRGEVRDFEIRNKVTKPAGVLWVKRVKDEPKEPSV